MDIAQEMTRRTLADLKRSMVAMKASIMEFQAAHQAFVTSNGLSKSTASSLVPTSQSSTANPSSPSTTARSAAPDTALATNISYITTTDNREREATVAYSKPATATTTPSSASPPSTPSGDTSNTISVLTPKLPQATPARCSTSSSSHNAYDSTLVAVSASSPSKLESSAPLPSSPTPSPTLIVPVVASALVPAPTAALANADCFPNPFAKALRYITVATSTSYRVSILLLHEETATRGIHEIGEMLPEQKLDRLGSSHFMHRITLLLSDAVASCVLNQGLMLRPSWPPPKQFGIEGVGVQVRPIPWPSLGGCTVDVCLHSCWPYPYDTLCKRFSGEAMSVHWKLPWLLVFAFSVDDDK